MTTNTLQSFFSNDQANTVELYFCPATLDKTAPVFTCGWEQLPKLPMHLFRTHLDQELTEYCHRDLVYCYDRSNDSQRTYQKHWISDDFDECCYTLVTHEESHPAHRFPCTTEINEKRDIHRVQYKINNRMFFMVDKELASWTMYLRYQHAPNMDLDKMSEDWNQVVKQLKRSIYHSQKGIP